MDREFLIPSHEVLDDATLFFRCDWLHCIVKIQRQILALTAIYNDHSACNQIVDRLGGNYGVFNCCHGETFPRHAESTVGTQPTENRNTENVSTGTPSTSNLDFLSNIENTEQFLEQAGGSYRNDAWLFLHFNSAEEYEGLRQTMEQFIGGRPSLLDSQGPASMEGQSSSASSSGTFDCPICMERLPRKLAFSVEPFKHSVCVDCTKSLLSRWHSSGNGNIQCPVCRRQFPISSYIKGFQLYLEEEDDTTDDESDTSDSSGGN